MLLFLTDTFSRFMQMVNVTFDGHQDSVKNVTLATKNVDFESKDPMSHSMSNQPMGWQVTPSDLAENHF